MSAPRSSPKNSNAPKNRTNSIWSFCRPTRSSRSRGGRFGPPLAAIFGVVLLLWPLAASGDPGGADDADGASSAGSSRQEGASGTDSEPLDGEALVDRALDKRALEFDRGRARLRLTVEDRGGERVEREMTLHTKEIGGESRRLVELTAPDDVDGQAFLFASDPDGEDDIWMYVPAFSVTRRIEGSRRQGAFLGSHFTYNDLESRSLREATYEREGERTVGDYEVHVVVARPDEGAESEYSKVRMLIRRDDSVPIRTEFYGDDGDLLKTLFVERLEETDEGATYVQRMKMQSESGGYTRLEVTELEPDTTVPDSAFTRNQLGE